MKVICIIQARSGATRLPNKVLLKLQGKTVLEHVVNRTRKSKLISDVFVATTINFDDIAIVKKCSEIKTRVFCGSEDDVLDRYYQLAKLLQPDQIVRITADCPVIDFIIIDKVIENHLNSDFDYSSNTLIPTYPDGLDVEIFSFQALKAAWKQASLLSEREHVTPYIIKNKNKFKLNNIENDVDLSKERWTLDEPKDYELIRSIYNSLYPDNAFFCMPDILNLLEQNPELRKKNQNIGRNEGYQKSIQFDRILTKE